MHSPLLRVDHRDMVVEQVVHKRLVVGRGIGDKRPLAICESNPDVVLGLVDGCRYHADWAAFLGSDLGQ